MQVMELLKSPNMTFASVSKIVGISQSSTVHIFDHHCYIPCRTFPTTVCIDEVYSPNSAFNESNYIYILRFLCS